MKKKIVISSKKTLFFFLLEGKKQGFDLLITMRQGHFQILWKYEHNIRGIAMGLLHDSRIKIDHNHLATKKKIFN